MIIWAGLSYGTVSSNFVFHMLLLIYLCIVWLLQASHSFGTTHGYLLLLLLVACIKGILSPYLCVICMEFLSHGILKAEEFLYGVESLEVGEHISLE